MNISNRQWFLAGVIAFSALSPRSVWANSKFLNVQGALTDSSGNPLTGSKTVTFRLYTSSTAAVASAFWSESLSITLSSGLFNVPLGNVTSLDSSAFNQLYYLGIQVAGDANELSPRQPLGASAYAQGSLGNFNVGNNLLAGSSVTAVTIMTSGDADIGGQAVISGSMTVQGNAFSVGGGSFAVYGGVVSAPSLSATTMSVTAVMAANMTASLLTATTVSGTSITASAFFGDGSHLTGLFNLPVGTILPYASSSTPPGYLECNGASYSTSTFPNLYSAIGCTWGCSGSNFNIPDLRGVFPRGWNHSITTTTYTGDYDAVSRSTISTGGNSGDKVGSYEADQFASHTHTYYSPSTGGNAGQGASSGSWGAATQTGGAGGNETRPKNAFVMYIIKYDSGASTIAVSGYVSRSGDTMTGALHMTNAPIVLTSTGGYVSSSSSVTASAFFGDGSHLTGIAGGTVGISSSCAAGYYLSSATWVNGVATGGGCVAAGGSFSGGTVANQTTFLSSITVLGTGGMTVGGTITDQGNLIISNGFGLGYPTGSTVAIGGWTVFIDSTMITGSTSTASSGDDTTFSTFTVLADTLKVGDELVVECMFQNSSSGDLASANEDVVAPGDLFRARDYLVYGGYAERVRLHLTLVRSKAFFPNVDSLAVEGNNGGTYASNAAISSDSGLVNEMWPIDQTANQTFKCAGSATGGSLNFLWMKVSKQ
jgi:microcystin-dependent protein